MTLLISGVQHPAPAAERRCRPGSVASCAVLRAEWKFQVQASPILFVKTTGMSAISISFSPRGCRPSGGRSEQIMAWSSKSAVQTHAATRALGNFRTFYYLGCASRFSDELACRVVSAYRIKPCEAADATDFEASSASVSGAVSPTHANTHAVVCQLPATTSNLEFRISSWSVVQRFWPPVVQLALCGIIEYPVNI